MSKETIQRCPTCTKEIRYSLENPYRPFCCHRCKLVDLGAWATESYRIPTTDSSVDFNPDEEQE